MKKLRRSLSLVLVFALVFALVGTAFAGNFDDYKDADQLDEKYVEAADYLIAAGVIVGNGDGTLDPKGDLTREQAAKLVAYAMLGQTKADALAADTDPFDDVKKDSWSAGYVAYCQKQGIINGDGDGKFRPEDNVTGYEFGKMMLSALGYGVNGEFTGDNWSTNVGSYAMDRNLYAKVLDAASNSPINREQAFQIMFNACQMIPVQYNKSFDTYFAGSPMYGDPNLPNNDYDFDTLGEIKFGLTKNDGKYDRYGDLIALNTDEYGFIGHTWDDRLGPVTDFYHDGKIIDTLVGPLSGPELAPYNKKSFDDDVTYIFNGREEEKIEVENPQTHQPEQVDVNGENLIKAGVPAGMTATLLDVDGNGKIDMVVAVQEIVYAVIATSPDGATTDGVTGFAPIEDPTLAKKDLVLTVPNFAKNKFITAEKTETNLEGEVTGYNAEKGYILVDGEQYYVSSQVRWASTLTGISTIASLMGNSYEFITDSTGAIVYVVKLLEEEAPDYVLVLDSALKAASDDLADGSTDMVAKAKIMTLEGETKVVDVYTYQKGPDTMFVAADAAATKTPLSKDTALTIKGVERNATNNVPHFYSYVIKDDGSYQFKALDENKAKELEATQKVETTAKSAEMKVNNVAMRATSATTINEVSVGNVTTLTGYNNFETTTTKYVATAAVEGDPTADPPVAPVEGKYILVTGNFKNDANLVKAVYAMTAAPGKPAEVYGYYTGKIGDVTADGIYCNFYVEGKAESYLQDAAPANGKGIYTVTATPNGVQIGDAAIVAGPVAVTASDEGYFQTEAGYYYFDENCKVYDATTMPPPGGMGAEAEIVVVPGEDPVYVTFVYEADPLTKLNMVKVVYIVDADQTPQ